MGGLLAPGSNLVPNVYTLIRGQTPRVLRTAATHARVCDTVCRGGADRLRAACRLFAFTHLIRLDPGAFYHRRVIHRV
jgi:hypothetical protein